MPYHHSSDDCFDSEDSYSEDSDSSSQGYSNYKKRKFYSYKKTPKPNKSRSYQHQFRPASSHQTFQRNTQAGVYVLINTQTGIFYVGKSNNVAARIQQHMNEKGPGVLAIENTITSGSANDLESWERNEVLTRMYRYGMDSVRGWRYTRSGNLTTEEKMSARNDIMEKFDLCRRCGHNNHFVDKCFARSPAAWCKDIPMQ
jgi:hypothetical protein